MLPVTPLQTQTLLTQETTTVEQRLSHLQAEETTGRIFQTPSGNPLAEVSTMQFQQSLAQTQQFEGHLTAAESTLNAVAGGLETMVNTISNAQSLAVSAKNNGITASDRSAMVQQVDGMIQNFVTQLNRQYEGQYLFAAHNPLASVATSTTVTNVPPTGSSAYTPTLPTSPVTDLPITVNGFESGIWPGSTAPSVFQQALTALNTLASTIPTGHLSSAETALQQAATALTSEQTLVGARLEQAGAQMTQTKTWANTLKTAISTADSANMPSVTAKLAQATQSYQAALQSGADLLQTENLLAFLHP